MNGAKRKPCLCMLNNMDDDDVVMHDADCSYCDGGLLETAFLEDDECDSGSLLGLHDVDCPDEGRRVVILRTEEKRSVGCDNSENKEAQLDEYIAEVQRNNAKLLQRFYEVQEDKKQAERRDKEWRRRKRTATGSPRVSLSPWSVRTSSQTATQSHRSVRLAKEKKKHRREVIMC